MLRHCLTVFCLGSALLAQVPQCLITGRVVDLAGAPIAGAGIGVPGDTVVASGENGRFALELAVQGDLRFDARQVFVTADGRVSYRLPIQPILVGARAAGATGREELELGDLRLPKAVTFRGRVRGPDGAPLAGVRITAFDELSTNTIWEAGWGSACVTEANGRFALAGVFDKGMRIEFEADGHYVEVVRGAGIGTPLDIHLEPSGFVQGPLPRMGGGPFDGWIYLLSEFPGARGERVRARGERFSITVATRGRFRVVALGPSGATGWQSDVLTGPTTDVALPAIVTYESGMPVRAVDADSGEQLGQVRVAVRWWNRELPKSLRRHLIRQVNSARPSSAPLVSPPTGGISQGYVAVAADGHAPVCEKIRFDIDGHVEVALQRAGSISGRVVDAEGRPLADCLVECESRNTESLAPSHATRTSADGGFRFRELAREQYVVRASSSPMSPIAEHRCDLTDEAGVEVLSIAIPAGVAVSGKVEGIAIGAGSRIIIQDTRGARQGSWEKSMRHPDPWNLAGVASAPLLPDGSFTIPNCRGGTRTLELFVPPPPRGGAPIRLPLRKVVIGTEPLQIAIDAPERRPGAVAGAVRIEGAPVPAGRLVVVARPRAGERDGRRRDKLAALHWQLAAGDGAFSIPLPPGPHRLQVIDCVTGIALQRAADEIEIDVEPGRTVSQDLKIEVVAAEVSFSMSEPGPALVDHVQVGTRPMRPGLFAGESALFGGGTYGYPGVYVEGRKGPARFFVSPGPVSLKVGGATRLDAGSIHFGNDRASANVDAVAGEVLRVELELKASSDL